MSADRLTILREIKEQHQARKVTWNDGQKNRKLLVDASTANVVLAVHDACNDENKAKLLALPWPKMCQVAWRVAA